jgi:hypothetical protein
MLPGVHDALWYIERGQCADDWRGLDEVRPCAEHVGDRGVQCVPSSRYYLPP